MTQTDCNHSLTDRWFFAKKNICSIYKCGQTEPIWISLCWTQLVWDVSQLVVFWYYSCIKARLLSAYVISLFEEETSVSNLFNINCCACRQKRFEIFADAPQLACNCQLDAIQSGPLLPVFEAITPKAAKLQVYCTLSQQFWPWCHLQQLFSPIVTVAWTNMDVSHQRLSFLSN